MQDLTMTKPNRLKHIWVHRCWIPRSDPLRIPIGDRQSLANALRSLNERIPRSFYAITSDGAQTGGEELTGAAVQDDAIIRTALMQNLPGGGAAVRR